MTTPAYALRDGNSIPAIGLGTYGLDDQAGIDAIAAAIADGYRLIDTAFNYGNEEAVGEAIRRTDVDRSDLLVTTKMPGRHHGYDETHRELRAVALAGSASTGSTCTSSTGRCRASTSTSTPGAP